MEKVRVKGFTLHEGISRGALGSIRSELFPQEFACCIGGSNEFTRCGLLVLLTHVIASVIGLPLQPLGPLASLHQSALPKVLFVG